MKLNDLVNNEGSKKDRRRVGRGIAAGQGKTCGRGTKGQNSRAGSGGHLYRQGGNLPIYRRLPFLRGEGFTPPNQVEFNEVNVGQLNQFASLTVIDPQLLLVHGIINKPENPVVILGNGELDKALNVKVHRVSQGAKAKILAAGGSVEIMA